MRENLVHKVDECGQDNLIARLFPRAMTTAVLVLHHVREHDVILAQIVLVGGGQSIALRDNYCIGIEVRARRLLMGDLSDLSARVSRTEERLSCDTMLDNGCIMRHQTDDPEICGCPPCSPPAPWTCRTRP